MMNPRIYVGTCAKYNNGSSDGEWLDLTDYVDVEDFMEACRELHKDEQDPELMFQDHEDCYGYVSESSIDSEIFELLEKDDYEQDIICLYREDIDESATFDYIMEAYSGTAYSEADFAEEQAEEMGYEVPSWVVVDWEATWYANLRRDYSTATSGGDVYFFRDH